MFTLAHCNRKHSAHCYIGSTFTLVFHALTVPTSGLQVTSTVLRSRDSPKSASLATTRHSSPSSACEMSTLAGWGLGQAGTRQRGVCCEESE